MNPSSPEQSSSSTGLISTEWDNPTTPLEEASAEHLSTEALQDIGKKTLQGIASPDSQELSSEIPEDYKTADDLAGELKVHKATVRSAAQRRGINGQKFKKKGQSTTFYSPEEQETIENELFPEIPEDCKTADELADKWKVSSSTIKNYAKKIKITGKKIKIKGNQTIFYAEDEQEKIYEALQELLSFEYPPEDEDWKNQHQIANQFEGFSKSKVIDTIKKLAEEGRIKGKKFKSKKNNQLAIFYSEDEQEKIYEALQEFLSFDHPPEDEDWKNQYQIFNQFEGKISHGKIERTINKLEEAGQIKGRVFRGGNNSRLLIFYSEDEQEKINEALQEFLSFEYPPKEEDWKNQAGIVNQLVEQFEGLSKSKVIGTIKKLIDEGKIKGQVFKCRNDKPAVFYSEDEQEKIYEALQEFLSFEYPPEEEDWKNQENIADQLADQFEGLSKSKVIGTIKKLIDEVQITGQIFKDSMNRPITFYSEDEQEKIYGALQEFLSFEYPPEEEDWKNQENIANQLVDQFKDQISTTKVKKAIKKLVDEGKIKGKVFKSNKNQILTFYSKEEQSVILEELENSTVGTSFPETAFFFYIQQAISSAESRKKPEWLKGPLGGQMEIDIYFEYGDPPRKIGIEYDGARFHDETREPSDIHKNKVAEEHGIEIIRIREDGCPELPDNISCISVQGNNYNKNLAEPIEQLFITLGIPLPEAGIDIKRDAVAINALMRKEMVTQDLDAAKNRGELSVAA